MTRSAQALLAEAAKSFQQIVSLAPDVERAAALMIEALRRGNRLFFCGNGGSAADAQHLAAEFLGRFLIEREPLPAIALTVNTSALTAIGNDYGYQEVFARQLRGLARRGDVLVGLSTSGKSANVVAALTAAREIGVATIGMTGRSGNAMEPLCDVCVCAPSDETPRIQEMHIAAGHTMCCLVEAALA
jgi:D-sedoheptulose 7-phosphate isomerase